MENTLLESSKRPAQSRVRAAVSIPCGSTIFAVIHDVLKRSGNEATKQVFLSWACAGASLEGADLGTAPRKVAIPMMTKPVGPVEPIILKYRISGSSFLHDCILGTWQRGGPRSAGAQLLGFAEQVLKIRTLAPFSANTPGLPASALIKMKPRCTRRVQY